MSNGKNHALAAILSRQGSLPRVADLVGAEFELISIEHSLQRSGEAAHSLRQLVPIRVVACIEGSLKAATAELINHGDPYRGNARRLFQQVKIDFDTLRALLDDQVSIGEIVAHSLGWHDMGEINSRMTALLGFEFFEKLKTIEDRWEVEIQKGERKPIVDSLDRVLADIDDALKVRHILCHETATFQRVSEADANRMLESGKKFTGAVSWLISETLRPNEPLTQTDMNISAGKRAAEADEELNKEVELLLGRLQSDEDKNLLTASQGAWSKYCHAFAELVANAAKGGTMWSMLFSGSKATMTQNRISEIRECRQEGRGGRPKRRRRPR